MGGQRAWTAEVSKAFWRIIGRPGVEVTLMVVTFGVLATVAGTLAFDMVQFERKGVEADGIVVEQRRKGIDVVFTTAAGQRVRASIKEVDWEGSELPKVGAKVRIQYWPSHPAQGAIDARGYDRRIFGVVLFGGFAVAFGIWACLTQYRSRKRSAQPRKSRPS
ncbi:DUF3592 domain-containing protein [Actinomadura rudentiformis]|uniref:DUF3592 domain-containing protein n=1 Tax=Actinomadura rudentiformis TaxID=359158 RepID=A0A6H9YRD0_9ACTN|nr:DUF3592 domain-containing protein [Actinomadura rudentiformis]KAB2350248.1 DUF3592 domain-containing protein [Actinomadura rudentiformis]